MSTRAWLPQSECHAMCKSFQNHCMSTPSAHGLLRVSMSALLRVDTC